MIPTRRPRRGRRALRAPESLEPRLLMAVFTVNSFADILSPPAGTVTLRSAIQAANASPGADTINLPHAGTYKISLLNPSEFTHDNSAGEFDIADAGNLTIQNTSGGAVTIDGGGLNRVFGVDLTGPASPSSVTFQGLIITGGYIPGNDGAGIDVGNANVTLNQCDVVANAAFAYGGGIAVGIGSLALIDTEVVGNFADGGGGIASLGSGKITVDHQSLIAANVAAFSYGGGGIYVVDDGPMDIEGAVIRDNRALAGHGGGIAIDGGGNAAVTIAGSTIEGNDAGMNGGGIAIGGSGNPTVTIAGSTIEGNDAGMNGGGIAIGGSGNPTVTIAGDLIEADDAGTNGGGIGVSDSGEAAVTITGSLVEGNGAAQNGGGYADSATTTTTVLNSFWLDNNAGNFGGGLAAIGPHITLDNTTVGDNTSYTGGGVYVDGPGTADVTDSSILGNMAEEDGGGIHSQVAALYVTGSTVADNRNIANNGGGLFSSTFGQTNITQSQFRDNVAVEGGGIATMGGHLAITGSQFTGNSETFGGAAYLDLTVFSIAGSTFDANRASAGPSALLLVLSQQEPFVPDDSLTDSTIVANTSNDSAISLSGAADGVLHLIDDTIDGNTSASPAGGVDQEGGTLVVQGTIMAGNIGNGTPGDYDYVGGTLTDDGGNLLGTTAGDGGKFGIATIVANPKLGPLGDNGGPSAGAPSDSQVIPTQALLPGSPAFAKGVAAGAPTTDERGFGRSAKPSIGAYEPQYASNASANQVFVENLYEVLLNRVADPGSLASAVSYLNGGGAGVTLVQILQGSTELRDIEATQVFERYLDRVPSPTEQANAANYLASATPEQLAAFLVEQPEFYNDYGDDNDVFVEALYGDILDRTASTSERDGWVQLIAKNGTRSGVAEIFLGLPAYLDLLVEADYSAYLGRLPSPAEQTNLAAMWPGFNSLDIQALLLGYGEAFARRT